MFMGIEQRGHDDAVARIKDLARRIEYGNLVAFHRAKGDDAASADQE
ncbi:MAG: hypothetical protein H0X24_03475 [Ktedonobacterales bacterium]|nr:hypothetical protein [Ktedonobacterales bacterium]